jgi:hypothetical protein
MRAPLLAIGCLALALGGCGSSSPTGSGFGDAGPGGGGGDDAGAGGGGDDGGGMLLGDGSTVGPGNGCTGAATNFVYVLSVENDLYSFAPDKKQFTKIGALGCQTSMTPNSMAVDRNATAWVNYVAGDMTTGIDTAGAIFQVSTKDASCQGPAVTLPDGWYRLGMGYATQSATSTAERLYVAATGDPLLGGGAGLGLVDFGKKTVGPIGSFTGTLAGKNAELTGTGDGRLFGFFTTTPVQVAEIQKGSGAVTSASPLAQVETPAYWAFSFWGGRFYLYTCPDSMLQPARTTNVSVYDPATGTVDPAYMTDIGFRIVGAGVSTCAPVKPPQ